LNKKQVDTFWFALVGCTTFIILGYIYSSRITYSILNRLNTGYFILIIYGIVVTPFLLFKFAVAYRYRPVPDLGFRPRVSVIVPVLNEEKMISQTINALLTSNYPKEKIEIIVVNDGSTDRTQEIVSKIRGVKLINHSENRGKRFAFATGMEQSTGDFLVCVDSDSIIDKDAIINLVQPFKDKDVYCTCGHGNVLNKKTNFLTRFQSAWYSDSFRITKGLESSFGMVTCCSGVLAAYRREGIKLVINDWLNEKFLGRQMLGSDDRRMTNLMLKLHKFVVDSPADDRTLTSYAIKRKRSTKSIYQSNAVVYTVVPDTFKKFFRQQVRWGRGSFRGMMFGASFFWKRPLKQSLLFYFLVLVNYLSPFVFFFNLVVLPMLGQLYLAIYYIGGLVLVNFIKAINVKQLVKTFSLTDILYRTAFVAMTFPISIIYLYCWATVWEGKRWYTRDDSRKSILGPPTVVH
jgi:hyaluronan synthase